MQYSVSHPTQRSEWFFLPLVEVQGETGCCASLAPAFAAELIHRMTSPVLSRTSRALTRRKMKTKSLKSRVIVDTHCVCDGSGKDDRKIGCEVCDNWYHFDCINLTPAKAEEISIYVCNSCHLRTGKRSLFKWEGVDPDSYLLELIKQPQRASPSMPISHHLEDISSSDQESDLNGDQSDGQHWLESDAALESEDSSTDFSDSDKGNISMSVSRKRSIRVRRRISPLSSGSASDNDRRGISRTSEDAGTAQPRPKRKANVPNTPAKRPRTTNSKAQSAVDDPARKYCLTQLQNVLNPIFEEYALNHSKEKAEVGDNSPADAYASAVESHLFQIFSEADRSGSPAVGQKYKAQFRMLTFNLEKRDRVVLRQGIGSGLLSASELSTMSNADLASEQQKKEMETAQKESLQHSILETRGTDRPLRKITHKGEEVIEDSNMDDELVRVRASIIEDEPDRGVRIPAANAPVDLAIQPSAIPLKSPVQETFTPISPSLSKSQESQIFHGVRVTLSDTEGLHHLPISQETGDLTFDTASSSPLGPDPNSGNTDPPSTEAPLNATGSEFVADSQPDMSSTTNRFDLNSIAWSSSPPVGNTIESSDVYDGEPGLSGPDPVPGDVDFTVDATDEHDFNMFLDEQTSSNPPPTVPLSPTVWTGEIRMPSPPIRCAVDAQLVAGRPPDFREPTFWASLFTSPSLNVEGRVPVSAARTYLLDSRLNSGRELVAVVFEPRQESDRANFDELVQFLLGKDRHGVVFPWGPASPDAPGKELYLVPLLPEAPLPEYLMMLDYLSFPTVRAAVVLIGFFILHKTKKPTRHSNFSILTNPAPVYPSPNPPNPPNPLNAPLSGSLDFDLSAFTPEFIADFLKNNPSISTVAAAAFSPVSQPSFYHDAPYVAPASYNPPYPIPPSMTPAPSHPQYPPVVPLASNTPRYIDNRSPEHDRRRRDSYESPRARGRGRGGPGGHGGYNAGPRSPAGFGPVDNGWASRRRGRGGGPGRGF